jgi:trehalose synthase
VARLHDVPVAPLSIERFSEVLDAEAFGAWVDLAERARSALRGRVVWCVNSTANGGGVAEMLRSLLAYTRGAGVDSRWVVIEGEPEFFALTKRLHNCLHAAPGAIAPTGADRDVYGRVTGAAAREIVELVAPGDVVILHDPQTAGLAPALHERGIGTAWRCHVGVDRPTAEARAAWSFLSPYVRAADAYVFSRAGYFWDELDGDRSVVIPPSIDVFSAKNQALDATTAQAILATAGILENGRRRTGTFMRHDGSPGRVDRAAEVWQEGRVPHGAPVVTQVSRWDRLKDPLGGMEGFAMHAGTIPDAHLVVAGPATSAVADDPEGAEVLEEVVAAWRALPDGVRARVHLAALPMDDAQENAAIVNALQSHATVVVQKSIAEGFGLTVAEAMWKGRAVVASRIGGIQDQIVDGTSGILVDPLDLDAYGRTVARLLGDPGLAQRLGAAARERVREAYLGPRHLAQWFEVVERIARPGRAGGAVATVWATTDDSAVGSP